jgi:DNA-binding MarR family transcriptional regulator
MNLEDLLKKPVTLRDLAKLTGEGRSIVKYNIREMEKGGYNIIEISIE